MPTFWQNSRPKAVGGGGREFWGWDLGLRVEGMWVLGLLGFEFWSFFD